MHVRHQRNIKKNYKTLSYNHAENTWNEYAYTFKNKI